MANCAEIRPSFWDTRVAESNPFDATNNEKDKAVLGDVAIAERIRRGSVPEIHGEAEALAIARKRGWQIEALMIRMEMERVEQNARQGFFDFNFTNQKHFIWLLVGFAAMGGLLYDLNQSLISAANLYMPKDLGLTIQQNSLVNFGYGTTASDATIFLCSFIVTYYLSAMEKTIARTGLTVGFYGGIDVGGSSIRSSSCRRQRTRRSKKSILSSVSRLDNL